MNEPPDQTAEFSAANLLSAAGMTVAEVLLDDVRVLAQPGVHVQEDDALLLEVLADRVVDDLGLVLGRDTRQELALGLGDAQLVEGVLDIGGNVVPGLLGAALTRAHVVEDVLEVDLVQVGRRPGGHRLLVEDVQRAQAELEHPLRLVLVGRDLLDDLAIQAALRLEDVLLGIAEAVLVVLGQILWLNGHQRSPPLVRSMPRRASTGS